MVDLVHQLREDVKTASADSLRVMCGWGADEIERLRAENSLVRDMLREVADDLESEVEGRYAGIKDHPAMTPKYERDLDSVKRARLFLGSVVQQLMQGEPK